MSVVTDASTWSMIELTADGQSQLPGGHAVLLGARALPYQGVEFGGSQRCEFSWLPGSPQATVQVFGSDESDTTINGTWKDRFLNQSFVDQQGFLIQVDVPEALATFDGAPVADAMDLVQKVDLVRRRGQLLLVQWESIVRIGILKDFKYKFLRRQDIEWTMTFGWMSQGDPPTAPVFPPPTDLTDIGSQWRAQLDSLLAKVEAPFAVTEDFQLLTDAFVNTVTASVRDISTTASNISTSIQSPSDAVKRTAGTLSGIESAAEDFADALMETPPWDLILSGLATLQNQPVVLPPIVVVVYLQTLMAQAFAMARLAALQQAELAKRLNPGLVAVYVARDDVDLRYVSNFYYGTPDQWRGLKAFNNLTTTRLEAGQTIFVPQLTLLSQLGGAC